MIEGLLWKSKFSMLRQFYWTGTITTKYGTRYTFDNDDILKGSAYVNNKSCSADEIELGSVYAAEMKITLFNNIDRYTLLDAEVTLTYHLVIDENTVEDVPMKILSLIPVYFDNYIE